MKAEVIFTALVGQKIQIPRGEWIERRLIKTFLENFFGLVDPCGRVFDPGSNCPTLLNRGDRFDCDFEKPTSIVYLHAINPLRF